jgi:hypothetical protein
MKANTQEEEVQGTEIQKEKKSASASYTLRAMWSNIEKLYGLGLWNEEEKEEMKELHKKAVQKWVSSFQS